MTEPAVADDDPSADLASIPVSTLIVDDDELHAEAVAEALASVGCECELAHSGTAAVERIESDNWDLVVTDLRMKDVDGLGILRKVKEELPQAEVIVLTGHSSISSAVTAMQGGAYTYLTKPLDVSELRQAVGRAVERVRLIRRNARQAAALDERFGFEGVVGNSQAMQRVLTQLRAIAPTDATVLIQGENGTGKELVARAIHQNSPRKSKPFVPLNISALPESILESELFGHEAGAFTGAAAKRIGKFEHANGGTLFLDEVGEMPPETQVKLLRVLEERRITRLGSNDERPVNVRIVAATNADLKQMMQDGTFREDLYYRLGVLVLPMPPLRERKADLPLLTDHFVKEFAGKYGKPAEAISRRARAGLMEYDWPGNIRQLRNAVERMVVLDSDGLLDVDDLPIEIAEIVGYSEEVGADGLHSGEDQLVGRTLTEVERHYIAKALELTGGKREDAAKMLGIGERTLYRKIKEYGLN